MFFGYLVHGFHSKRLVARANRAPTLANFDAKRASSPLMPHFALPEKFPFIVGIIL